MGSLAGFSHVALTVRDIATSRHFYEQVLGMRLLDSSDNYCAFATGSTGLTALILTSHDGTPDAPFSEMHPGLDHVSFAVSDLAGLDRWETELAARGVRSDRRRSEWGHHLNFRDPDNIALEFVVLDPDSDVQAVLDRAREA
jgi:catechol 2,3-dioxygenase-like lactoylglutathione lyase family enzyme